MAERKYQICDLIEINWLMGELMDPHQEAEAACDEDGVCWEIVEELQAKLRSGDLTPLKVVWDARLPTGYDARAMEPLELADGSFEDFYERIQPCGGREVHVTLASVKALWAGIRSARGYKPAEEAQTPAQAEAPQGVPQTAAKPKTRNNPLPEAKEAETVAHLRALGELNDKEAVEAVAALGYYVSRERVRKWKFHRRGVGQKRKAKCAMKCAEK